MRCRHDIKKGLTNNGAGTENLLQFFYLFSLVFIFPAWRTNGAQNHIFTTKSDFQDVSKQAFLKR